MALGCLDELALGDVATRGDDVGHGPVGSELGVDACLEPAVSHREVEPELMEDRLAGREHLAAVLVPRDGQVLRKARLGESLAHPVVVGDSREFDESLVHILCAEVGAEAHDRIGGTSQDDPEHLLALGEQSPRGDRFRDVDDLHERSAHRAVRLGEGGDRHVAPDHKPIGSGEALRETEAGVRSIDESAQRLDEGGEVVGVRDVLQRHGEHLPGGTREEGAHGGVGLHDPAVGGDDAGGDPGTLDRLTRLAQCPCEPLGLRGKRLACQHLVVDVAKGMESASLPVDAVGEFADGV